MSGDCLGGDSIADLRHTAERPHRLSHEVCREKILAIGGGGYDPVNVSAACSAVVRELARLTC